MTLKVVGTRDEWLDALHPLDRAAIEDVLQHSQDDVVLAASVWVQMSTTDNLIPHSAGGGRQSAARIFIKEFHEFLCGNDPKYVEARSEAGGTIHPQAAAASALSAVLASYIDVAAAVIAPALTLLLLGAASAGKETMCQKFADFLASNDEPPNEGRG